MDLFKKCFDYTRIEDLKEAGLYPYFHYLTTGQDTVVQMEGKRTIMIGSNNYLGLTSNQEVIDAGVEAIKKYGNQVKYVIMSWAPDKQETDWEVLQLLRKDYPEINLLVIGEKNGATNSKIFWHNAQLSQDEALQKVNRQLHSFDLIDEQIYLAK